MGHDLWISLYPLETKNGCYFYNKNKPNDKDNIDFDILQISYNYGSYSNICWTHIPDIKFHMSVCACPKEKLWHVFDDFHKRLGYDIARRATEAMNKLDIHGYSGVDRFNSYPCTNYDDWSPQMHINHFYGILKSFKEIGEQNPFHLFGIHDHDVETVHHWFIGSFDKKLKIYDSIENINDPTIPEDYQDDKKININDTIQVTIVPNLSKKKKKTKYKVIATFGSAF
jgi:hypothetical protein